jgi:PhnB protein
MEWGQNNAALTTREKTMAKVKAKAKKRKVPHMPKGYHAVTPYLSIRGAAEAIAFYKKAFGAKEVMRMPGPEGKLGHAEIELEGHRVMLSDEYEAMEFMGPQTRGGTTVHLHVYVPDVDKAFARAVAAGARVKREPQDQFYGDRSGSLEDPFGHMWHLATHVEDVPAAELKKRAAAMAKAAGKS